MSRKKSTALSVKSISLDSIKVRCDKKREENVNIAGMHLLLSIEEELGIFFDAAEQNHRNIWIYLVYSTTL